MPPKKSPTLRTLTALTALGISAIGCNSKKPAVDPVAIEASSVAEAKAMEELAALAAETRAESELAALAAEAKAMEELAALAAENKVNTEQASSPAQTKPQSEPSNHRQLFVVGAHSLSSIGDTSASSDATRNAGTTNHPEGPKSSSSNVETTGSNVANATSVVKNMRARFRGCYQTGLRSNPYMSGSVMLTAVIGPDGQVKKIIEAGNGGLTPIIPCLKAVVGSGNFAPPVPKGNAKIGIPIKFVQQ